MQHPKTMVPTAAEKLRAALEAARSTSLPAYAHESWRRREQKAVRS